jgi:hypothetical protein
LPRRCQPRRGRRDLAKEGLFSGGHS